jgi:hypothetical protein
VATDLSVLTPLAPLSEGVELQYAWSAYRRLDPRYYAYLFSRMGLAKTAAERQLISTISYHRLRDTFAGLHGWARTRYGDHALREALQHPSGQAYPAPIVGPLTLPALVMASDGAPHRSAEAARTAPHPFAYPAAGEYRFTHAVTWGAVLLVDMIRDHARSLGWDDASLYQNRSALAFPCGQEYGLVCFLGPDVAVSEVTRGSIALVSTHPGGGTVRWYHPTADHPWRTRCGDAVSVGG